MWEYQKKLQFPINIKNPNPKLAAFIVSQYGGPDGELGASMRYLSQRFSMKDDMAKALLTDIGKSWDYCSHTGHQPSTLNLTPLSICVGASLNKHPNALCQKLQSCQ